jgi:hypothetical protein
MLPSSPTTRFSIFRNEERIVFAHHKRQDTQTTSRTLSVRQHAPIYKPCDYMDLLGNISLSKTAIFVLVERPWAEAF